MKLFGTDGIRGVANEELTSSLAFRVGKAVTHVLSNNSKEKVKIIIGMDTRLSGDMIEASLTAGITSSGADVYVLGVIPTPAVAYITRTMDFTAGIVISASHNPFGDNGIKIFNGDGFKLKDEIEEEIESIILDESFDFKLPKPENIGRRISYDDISQVYEELLLNSIDNKDFKNIKVVLDCANGATYKIAPKILKELDCDVTVINAAPNGININDKAGSTHMEGLAKTVIENQAQIGIAYDGDGDRCLMVNEDGDYVDGDEIMSICAKNLFENDKLKNNGFVATVMSNLGLFLMEDKNKIKVEEANVGDRYVLEKMIEDGYNFGGEQSGHVIFLDYNTTGDGILTSLQILNLMKKTGKSLKELNDVITLMPQILLNVKVDNKKKYNYLDNEKIKKAISELEERFKGRGRVLIRPSGTEPLVRVMIESFEQKFMEDEAKKIAKLIEDELK